MITIRKSEDRGRAEHGWLDSRHTFSFGDYHDPANMGFRSLRVINDDRVLGGTGFGTHPHRDMEILSYVWSGALKHRDSMGNETILRPGDLQQISAGRGITHSEMNASAVDPVHFLQIWIRPDRTGVPPKYTERSYGQAAPGVLHLVVSRDGRDGSIPIYQDADVFLIRLTPGQTVTHELKPGRGAWLQVAEGDVSFSGVTLKTGDGASTEQAGTLTLTASRQTEAILFDACH